MIVLAEDSVCGKVSICMHFFGIIYSIQNGFPQHCMVPFNDITSHVNVQRSYCVIIY